MPAEDLNIAILIVIYSAVTHWEAMMASFDMMMEEMHAL
jgi:hypothetical protein